MWLRVVVTSVHHYPGCSTVKIQGLVWPHAKGSFHDGYIFIVLMSTFYSSSSLRQLSPLAVTSTFITLPVSGRPPPYLILFNLFLFFCGLRSQKMTSVRRCDNEIFWTWQIILKFIWKNKHAQKAWKILKKKHYRRQLELLKCCIKLQ